MTLRVYALPVIPDEHDLGGLVQVTSQMQSRLITIQSRLFARLARAAEKIEEGSRDARDCQSLPSRTTIDAGHHGDSTLIDWLNSVNAEREVSKSGRGLTTDFTDATNQ